MSDEDDDALGFATLAPAFLLHKAKASLEDDEALGLAKLCAGVDARHVSDAQSRPAFLLAGNVLRHLDARDRRLERERAAARERERAEHARELEGRFSRRRTRRTPRRRRTTTAPSSPPPRSTRARSLEDANAALASDLADARARRTPSAPLSRPPPPRPTRRHRRRHRRRRPSDSRRAAPPPSTRRSGPTSSSSGCSAWRRRGGNGRRRRWRRSGGRSRFEGRWRSCFELELLRGEDRQTARSSPEIQAAAAAIQRRARDRPGGGSGRCAPRSSPRTREGGVATTRRASGDE